MDGGYRLYCEDIDLCWRAWQSGLQVAYVPDAVVEHDLGELTRRRFVTRATLWHLRGMARFVRRHGLVTARRAGRLPHRTLAPEIS
jgi:GT2 family glycosyltransferase